MSHKYCDKPARRGVIRRRGLRSLANPNIITVQQAHEWPCCPNCDFKEYRFRKLLPDEKYMNLITKDWAYVMNCDVCGYTIGRIMKSNQRDK